MKLSELIAVYGDDKVQFQNLDQCAKSMNMNGGTTTITFGTEQRVHFEGMEKLGLVVCSTLSASRTCAASTIDSRPMWSCADPTSDPSVLWQLWTTRSAPAATAGTGPPSGRKCKCGPCASSTMSGICRSRHTTTASFKSRAKP